MPNRSSAAAMAMLPSVAATLPQVGEQLPNNLVIKTYVAQFRSCPSCGRYMRAIPTSEIYECTECRVFVTEPR
jgi:4-hydroxy-3-methylbut-2-en-1-yl diphosphate synthase IspG/GcpE